MLISFTKNLPHSVLYIISTSLPSIPHPLYLDPHIIEIACDKAGEVDKRMNNLIRAITEGLVDEETRNFYMNLDKLPELNAVSAVVGSLYLMVGLQALNIGIKEAEYSLTSACDVLNMFRYRYRSGSRIIFQSESVYSDTR